MGQALTASKHHSAMAQLAAVLVFTTVLSLLPITGAQQATTFSTTNHFDIPNLNGSIRFAYNGSYTNATLENNTWRFVGLSINGSQPQGTFTISVSDSNLTIYSFFASQSAANFPRKSVRYYAEGEGQQVFDIGVNGTTDVSEWWVTLPGGVFLAEGKDWQLLSNNTIKVSGQTGNVSVVHYQYGLNRVRDLPFLEGHSVALLTVVVVAVIMTAAVLISVNRRRR
jgi:hypothetical protein